MEAAHDYDLLDVGDGRRLERFGSLILDRPAPAAAALARSDPAAWAAADARFQRGVAGAPGAWIPADRVRHPWTIALDGLRLELRATPSGQVGLFPEHRVVAGWANDRLRTAVGQPDRPPEVLNLFAHTGLATLGLAAAGARVAHVDASRPAVAWARHNAELSGLADRPIRWLVEDAGRFVAREARREHRYNGVLMDPPTYGHGPRGGTWQLGADLEGLLAAVGGLLAAGPWFLACTVHATGADAGALEATVRRAIGRRARTEVRSLALGARSGARLPAGLAVLAVGEGGGPPR